MTKRAIVREPKPVLHQAAKEVLPRAISSKRVKKIISDLSDTLRASEDGIGIAAPQIGVSLRIFVTSEEALALGTKNKDVKPLVSDKKEEWRHFVFINPKLLKASRKKFDDSEGCLSVPHVFGTVPRAEKVKVAAYDERGKKFERGAAGLFARLLQHEMDHLDGHLFLEKARETHRVEKKV